MLDINIRPLEKKYKVNKEIEETGLQFLESKESKSEEMSKKGKKRKKKLTKDEEDEEYSFKRRKVEEFIDSTGEKIEQFKVVGEDAEKMKKTLKEDEKCHYLLVIIYDKTWDHQEKDRKAIKEKVQGIYGDDLLVKEWEKTDVTKNSLLRYLESYQHGKFGVVKLIVYYTGHAAQIGNEKHPSFVGKYGNQNTFEMHKSIEALGSFDLNIFVADCCSSVMKVRRGRIPTYTVEEKLIGFFDFVGNLYVRSSQKGYPAYGNETLGSFFTYFLTVYWDNDWIETIKLINRSLFGIQEASGIGNIVKSLDRDLKEPELK